MSKYSVICIYTKQGNLLPYLYTDKMCYGMCQGAPSERLIQAYTREREIQLMALFRFENHNGEAPKVFCKIKCPVNPLPVKGEFEAPSVKAIDQFLKGNGWNFKEKFYPRMFE